MFKKILIANRGEIAVRIIKTLRRMGIQSVAVYSEADRFHPHVQLADEAYCIGPAAPQQSYLNIDKIIAVAKKSQAQAIHPGYGFLSENAHFARACEKANIAFIGPSAQAMEKVGSKQMAKALLKNTSVPLIPGFHPENPSDEALKKAALDLGFPLVIKAAHGGGGKGIKMVRREEEWTHALQSARREAKSYFNNDELLLEKFIENPRHLEVQILGDHFGKVIHLFERDCSVQRRQQKIIEEAPAIHLPDNIRQKLYQHAIEVAQTFGYTNAGTVEFLLSSENQLYFMEMNARLQVEHPITEAITGLDLVELQIKIASGEKIGLEQPLSPKGHAIECRICAEQPEKDFKPSQGEIFRLKWPNFGRIDTGIVCHQSIESHYDSLLAKEIAWGENRHEAIVEMQNMLHDTELFGIESNIDYLQTILQDDTWQKGAVSIHFLATHSFGTPQTPLPFIMMAAAARLWLEHQEQFCLPSEWLSFSTGAPRFFSLPLIYQEQFYHITIHHPKPASFECEFENEHFVVRFQYQNHQLFLEINKQCYHFHVDKKGLKLGIRDAYHAYELEQATHTSAQAKTASQDTLIKAPMPATIVALYKQTGDNIKKGEPLMVLEAMKMEHTVYAPENAIIKNIYYHVGQQVADGSELIELNYEN